MNYNLYLPVFKQGDDLQMQIISNAGDSVKALRGLAVQYQSAASICDRVAEIILKSTSSGKIAISGDAHLIYLSIPKKLGDFLVKEGLIEKD